jgi:hypothetical protein
LARKKFTEFSLLHNASKKEAAGNPFYSPGNGGALREIPHPLREIPQFNKDEQG